MPGQLAALYRLIDQTAIDSPAGSVAAFDTTMGATLAFSEVVRATRYHGPAPERPCTALAPLPFCLQARSAINEEAALLGSAARTPKAKAKRKKKTKADGDDAKVVAPKAKAKPGP